MSLGIATIGAYASSRRTAAVVAMRADRVQAPAQAASKAEPAKAKDDAKATPAAAKSLASPATVASAAMAALMAAQERASQSNSAGSHVAEVLAALLERFGRKHPKPPVVTPPVVTPPVVTPPVVTPPVIVSPPPVVTPPVVTPPVIVTPPVVVTPPVATTPAPTYLDASVRQLQSVLERIRERPVSRFSDVPFSQRQAAPPAARAQRASAVNLKSMAAVAQSNAALAMLQAMQMSMFQFRANQAYAAPSPFRYSRSI